MSALVLLLFLAILQGFTEYLPVSSSGHLVLARLLIPGGESLPSDATVEVMLHLGTLLSVAVFYRQEIANILLGVFGRGTDATRQAHLAWLLLLGSIPAGIIGVFFKDSIEQTFEGTFIASLCLGITGCILWASRWLKRGDKELLDIAWKAALLIGVAQAFAIFPGISRSGATIICGLALGLRLESAASFSFLLSIPAIAGAAVLKVPDMLSAKSAAVDGIYLATSISFITGLVALVLLLRIARSKGLSWFAPYCWLLALIGLITTFA